MYWDNFDVRDSSISAKDIPEKPREDMQSNDMPLFPSSHTPSPIIPGDEVSISNRSVGDYKYIS